MAVTLTENTSEVLHDQLIGTSSNPSVGSEPFAPETMVADLGIWLSSMECFLLSGQRFSTGGSNTSDLSREFQLVTSALQRCSLMNARILGSFGVTMDRAVLVAGDITIGDLMDIAVTLRRWLLMLRGFDPSSTLGMAEWHAWADRVLHDLGAGHAYDKLAGYAEYEGSRFLPDPLTRFYTGTQKSDHHELILVIPRFARVLRWLRVVGSMLERDEPLKPALLIFAGINEQIQELTNYINSRIAKFDQLETEMIASLDAASYTASIELKKVFSQALAGVAEMRPAPSIYARMETAYSLLNDGFQQIIAGFAHQLDSQITIFDLFPSFDRKRGMSIILRDALWLASAAVQKAEKEPTEANIFEMKNVLVEFLHESLHYLFNKDVETVERFIEEILVTRDNKDLVPLLHRFGAYLDTLFGQVSLRAVLANQPFHSGGSHATGS